MLNKIKKEFKRKKDSPTFVKYIRELSSIVEKAIRNTDYNLIDEGTRAFLNGILSFFENEKGLIIRNNFLFLGKLKLTGEDFFFSNTALGRIISDDKSTREERASLVEFMVKHVMVYLESISKTALKCELRRATNIANEQMIRISLTLMVLRELKIFDEKIDYIPLITYNNFVSEIDRTYNSHIIAYERQSYFEMFIFSNGIHKKDIRDQALVLLSKLGGNAVINFNGLLDQLVDIIEGSRDGNFKRLLLDYYSIDNEEDKKIHEAITKNLSEFKNELISLKAMAIKA